MSNLSFWVHGLPAPQGSKRHVGGGVMVESSKKVKPWRQDVVTAAVDARTHTGHETYTGPVTVRIIFYFPRPKHHYRTGRHAHQLKPAAPVYVATKPDVDKLVRSTFDALSTAGVWRDDNQAVTVTAQKRYVDVESLPGARLELAPVQEAHR